ncbi:hypothetical protein DH2020_010506 [Rehmannia glutinosa]|uniref:Uncharacterized protein n=1 Tax=Rehmannia glutinosa TaxID=99300 RepID=A0ABR0XAT8_REHGL
MALLQERKMIDRFRLWAKGGGGVILECSAAVWDFSSLQHHINAKRGGHGAPKNMIGSRGADKAVLVPVGTVIHLLEGELPSSVEKKPSGALDPWDIPGTLDFVSSESSQQSPTDRNGKMEKTDNADATRLLHDLDGETNMSGTECEENLEESEQIQYNVAELTEPGQRITVAQGGDGGLGNLHYAKGSKTYRDNDSNDEISEDDVRAAPNIGLAGSEAVLLLELKSIADVGLVGMPNAGKSTLLGALSRAKPIVGHYAFTTLRPNLGNLNYDDLSITVADIPGLIRGAHENRGLGHAFLRHIERTKVLAYVLDLAAAIDGRKGIPPWEQLKDLMLELEFYREGLSDRPSLVVANKIDEVGAEEVYEELRERVPGVPIFPVCAVLGEGVSELKDGLKMLVNGEEPSTLKLDYILLD